MRNNNRKTKRKENERYSTTTPKIEPVIRIAIHLVH